MIKLLKVNQAKYRGKHFVIYDIYMYNQYIYMVALEYMYYACQLKGTNIGLVNK